MLPLFPPPLRDPAPPCDARACAYARVMACPARGRVGRGRAARARRCGKLANASPPPGRSGRLAGQRASGSNPPPVGVLARAKTPFSLERPAPRLPLAPRVAQKGNSVDHIRSDDIRKFMQFAFKSHPWHGVAPLTKEDNVFNAYIELVPTDTVKYEVDKVTGHLKVDRPQQYSSLCPALYGFLPRTYCGSRVGRICREATGRLGIEGDNDPLDICVLSEKLISHADILVNAIPIGGLRMIDHDQADDKIVAVLKGDLEYGNLRSIHDLPRGLTDRLRHYFLTYKQLPDPLGGSTGHGHGPRVELTHVYDRDEALAIIHASLQDYADRFGNPEESLIDFLMYLTRHARDHAESARRIEEATAHGGESSSPTSTSTP